MADYEIDNLKIGVEADTDKAENNLKKLEGSLRRLNSLTKSIRSLNNIVSKSSISNINSLVKSINGLGDKTGKPIKIDVDTSPVKDSLEGVTKLLDGTAQERELNVDTTTLTEAVDKLTELTDVITQERSINIDTTSIESKLDSISEKFDKILDTETKPRPIDTGDVEEAKRKLEDLEKEEQKTGDEGQKSGEKTSKAYKKANKSVLSTIKSMGKFLATVGKISAFGGKTLLKAWTTPFEHFTKGGGMNKFLNSIKRVMFYRAIRLILSQITKAFKEGVENLYNYSKGIGSNFSKSMDSLATSFLYLKNSIGAAVSPLINALAPAVELVIDKFVGLLNIFNQFISAMTGKSTWTKALKTPTQAFENSANNAKEATEKFKESLMGFDEINKLSRDNDNGSSGGGASGVDYSSMFTEETVNSGISDFVQQLKDKINSGDWYGAGTLLADKFNLFLDTANSYMSEEKKKQIVSRIGDIVDAFNGLINGIDWTKLGTTIANYLDLFVQSLKTIVTKTDWAAIGKGIADCFNAILNGNGNPNLWKGLGTTVSGAITGFLTAVDNFITNIDTGKLGKAVADFVKGFSEMKPVTTTFTVIKDGINALIYTLKNFVTEMNKVDPKTNKTGWETLADDISGGINQIFEIDFKAGAQAISGLASGLLDMFIDAIDQIEWKELGESIGTLFSNIKWGELTEKTLKAIGHAFAGLFEAAITLITTTDWFGVIAQILDGISKAFADPKAAFGLTIAISTLTISKIGGVLLKKGAKAVLDKIFGNINIGGGKGGTGGGGMSGGCQCECVCTCGTNWENALQKSTVKCKVTSLLGNTKWSTVGKALLGLGGATAGAGVLGWLLGGTGDVQKVGTSQSKTLDNANTLAKTNTAFTQGFNGELSSNLKTKLTVDDIVVALKNPSSFNGLDIVKGTWDLGSTLAVKGMEGIGSLGASAVAWLSGTKKEIASNLTTTFSGITDGSGSPLASMLGMTSMALLGFLAGTNPAAANCFVALSPDEEGTTNPLMKKWIDGGTLNGTGTITANGKKGTLFDTIDSFFNKAVTSTIIKTIVGKKGTNFDKVLPLATAVNKTVIKTIQGKKGTNFDKVLPLATAVNKTITKTLKGVKSGDWKNVNDKTLPSATKKVQVGISNTGAKILTANGQSSFWTNVFGSSLWTGTKWFAKGGVVDRPTNAIIGEAGKEVVMPLERNTGWMTGLANELVTRMNGYGGSSDMTDAVAEGVYRGMLRSADSTDGNIVITLDGKTVAQNTVKQLQMMARQGSYPLASLV